MSARFCHKSWTRSWCIVGLVALWAILYLPHLRTSPAWYGDETLTLMIGKSLFRGEGADRAFYATFWHPSYAYQPGYAWIVGLSSSLSGGDIYGARFFNSILALAIALLILKAGRRPFGTRPSFIGALIFLSYAQAIIHFRWIYSHNAVALGFTLTVLCLLRKSALRSDALAGCGLAIAALSHPLFVHGSIATWLCRIKRPISWFWLAFPPALALCAMLGWTLLRQAPNRWVFEDMLTLGQFYGEFSQENGSGLQPIKNIVGFYFQDAFHIGALICALICCRKKYYPIPVFLAVVSGLLLQNRQNLTLFYYQAVVFLPLLALAYAGALNVIEVRVRHFLGKRNAWAGRLFYAIPLFLLLGSLRPSIDGTWKPKNELWVTQNCQEVEAVAKWINAHTSNRDMVVCHQNLGWLLECRTTDFIQATAWSGRTTFTFEKIPAKDRFLYPAEIAAAKYLVIGDIDQRWTLAQKNVSWILDLTRSEKWKMVWQGADYTVLENPRSTFKN